MASPRHTTAPGTSVRAAWVRTSMPLGAVPLFHTCRGVTNFGQTKFGQHPILAKTLTNFGQSKFGQQAALGPPGFHATAREPKRAHFSSGPQKHHQISTEKTPQRGKKRMKIVAGGRSWGRGGPGEGRSWGGHGQFWPIHYCVVLCCCCGCCVVVVGLDPPHPTPSPAPVMTAFG